MILKNLSFEKFVEIINELYDEIIVYDNNYKIVYVNNASERHYGMLPEEMIGQSFYDYADEYWNTSVLPYVYRNKKAVRQNQVTILGAKIVTIAVPLLDGNGDVEYVCMSVRDELAEGLSENLYEIEDPFTDFFSNDLVYKSPQMRHILQVAEKILDVDSPCLITGESGVGKTLVGKYIHSRSKRKDKPFVHINCAAISKELFESELYGYVPGAFTGANKSGKKGYALEADGGTLFLDEITEIPYNMQAKLLQFIQDKTFYPVGSTNPVEVDVNIIAATNKDLKKIVELGEFREDLYYRLDVFEIDIPPLRERKEDIVILYQTYLNKYNKKYKKVHRFSKEVKTIFESYSWWGNIRELSHIIERLVVVSKDDIIKPGDLPKHLFELPSKQVQVAKPLEADFDTMVENFEREIIQRTYKEMGSSRKLAEKLGITQTKASRLIRKYK